MRKASSLLIAAFLVVPGAAVAQVGGGNPEDVESLDGILKAYYEVVSRPAGVTADRARDEWIHHPEALVGIAGVGTDDGTRWWILSWVYDRERAGNEIPAEFLPE